MKYCEKCKQNFPDNQIFCSNCGQQLSAINTSTPSTPNQNPPTIPTPTQSTSDGKKTNVWLSVIATGIGIILTYYVSVTVGFALGVAGLAFAVKSKKQGVYEPVPYILTWILGIIDIILFIYSLTL